MGGGNSKSLSLKQAVQRLESGDFSLNLRHRQRFHCLIYIDNNPRHTLELPH
ncbi:MAG: hypothetical protein BMS9Abin25_0939 [Gammaproteobacteria bacterium]|nr:MAG: hypothetical protein BMS9Abin25_0939 [Gammaproteobacteria bacterium]